MIGPIRSRFRDVAAHDGGPDRAGLDGGAEGCVPKWIDKRQWDGQGGECRTRLTPQG